MRSRLLWLRWSWRDLRARWIQVAAIALIIGLGSGVFSGLRSVTDWRRTSYDASYQRLAMYDLRYQLTEGTYVDAARLRETVAGIAHADALAAVESRLVEPTQVDASTGDDVILVPGRLVGVDLRDGGPQVNRIAALHGRTLRPSDGGQDVAVLDQHFANRHDLPGRGTLTLSGGQEIRWVGSGVSPEYYWVIGESGSFFADFAVLYAPLATVQRLTGHTGTANDVVLRVRDGADRDVVEQEVGDALRDAFPDAGFTVTRQEDDQVLRLLYDDIGGDQRLYNIFAILILAGAAFAAFNLTGRIVEAQRRELGIGMALGVSPARLAARPLLVGAQVALLGVVFGVGVGLVIDAFMADLLRSFQPLPVWRSDFRPRVFLVGAALGFFLPLLASLLPIRRAVRVPPVEAISTTHRAATGGLAPLIRRIPLPGDSVAELPVRNVLRAPRRTLLTALGIAAAITTLVGVLGMIDSFLATIDRGESEILGDAPDRVDVDLDFTTEDAPAVRAIEDSPLVGGAEPRLVVGGTLAPGTDDAVDVFLYGIDFDSPQWHPTAVEGDLRTDEPGLVIAEKAARDLGLHVGDRVAVRHPYREGAGYALVETELPVLAIHPNPYRFIAFFDRSHADLMNLAGIVNSVQVEPAPGVAVEAVQRAFFGQSGVVSVEPVSAAADAIREQIDEVLGVFTVIQLAMLLLALLIAFNSSVISMDERAREHATMFAFGLPVRSVLRMATVESLLTGVLGTIAGVLLGRLLLQWLITVLIPGTLPDIGVHVFLSGRTVLTALALGTVAVAVAPLLTLRRLRSMDIPSTLRVME